ALARVESGSAARTDQDLSAEVRERATAWESVFRKTGIELTADVEDGLRGRVLPDAVGRDLDALLDDAAKFLPPGSRVEVHATVREGTVVVRVADDGPEVPADQLPTLMRR